MPEMRRLSLLPRITLLATACALLAGGPASAEKFSHGASSVRVVDVPSQSNTDEVTDQKPELLNAGKPIASFSVSGYIRDAYWSPDGKWVAVNLRHANSGDYMWVLDAASGKPARQPSDDVEAPWE